MGEVHPALSGVGYSFRTQYTWTLGDFNAAQSPDAVYRLRHGLNQLLALDCVVTIHIANTFIWMAKACCPNFVRRIRIFFPSIGYNLSSVRTHKLIHRYRG